MNINFKGNKPQYMSLGAAGADLSSLYTVDIKPEEQVMIDTGSYLAIPLGHFGLVCPRSSLCNKSGLHMVNSVGIIDEDYRGSIKLVYKNTSKKVVTVNKGERIGQIIIQPYVKAKFVEVEELEDTVRGEGGFGSTGG